MTVVAYRDGVLAADSLSTCYGSRASAVLKIERVGTWLIGGAGMLGVLVPLRRWVEAGAKLDDPIDFGKIEDSVGMLIDASGELFYASPGDGWLVHNSAEFKAIGSGSDVALGAMYVGASAIEAVSAAKAIETSCGGSTVWLDVHGNGDLDFNKKIYDRGN